MPVINSKELQIEEIGEAASKLESFKLEFSDAAAREIGLNAMLDIRGKKNSNVVQLASSYWAWLKIGILIERHRNEKGWVKL
jgi:hypothetical protein